MEGATALCLNAISRRTVNICHLRIYISCYYLLGLGRLAVKPRGCSFWAGAHFRQREDQVVITAPRGRVLAAGVLYSDIPKGSNCVALSKMTPDLYFYQDDLFTQTGSCDHAVVFLFLFLGKKKNTAMLKFETVKY